MLTGPTKQPHPPNFWRVAVAWGIGVCVISAGVLVPRFIPRTTSAEHPIRDVVGNDTALPVSERPTLFPSVPTKTSTILQFAAVAVCLVLLVCVLAFWRYRQQRVMPASHSDVQLVVLATLGLPYRCQAHLVQVADERFLASVDTGGIRFLIPLPSRTQDQSNQDEPWTPSSALGVIA